MQTIKFSKNLTAKGRNGLMKQTGLELFGQDSIMFCPTNSKGATDSCWLEFPFTQIPELINSLKQEFDAYIDRINRAQGDFLLVVTNTKRGKRIQMRSCFGDVSNKAVLQKAKDLTGWEWYWRAGVELNGILYPF